MLLNFSNHPLNEWSDLQKTTAINHYNSIEDLAFPSINPHIEGYDLDILVEQYLVKIRQINPTVIHIMGEHTFTFKMVNELQKIGFPCIASTTERNASQDGNKKTIYFDFVRFRSY